MTTSRRAKMVAYDLENSAVPIEPLPFDLVTQFRSKERTMLRPLGNRVVVKPSEPPGKSTGGILLPDQAKEKPQRGWVLAVGKGKKNDNGTPIPLEVKVGDCVVYSKYTGNEIEVDGVKLLVMDADDILCVEEK